ncbi:hypothetical protein ART_2320 [Arthrobacter sp. PAMC 25486]|uniref:HNH endonuclease signature motif containing protein n=1 Tax=Arthrobacter sp. PAMC 25486 TaxID=1494608 RepID=UPI000535E6D0|nr:HNH endonuclease signature motif containing protein [Arthrobacter sp. PAMC 25486]AIY01919.1 hypothetical protein ART_2320 [Arthrobacter sp. PAMC 25486]
MDATAKEPGYPGSTQDGKAAGEHIHQLLVLAESLVRTAGAGENDALLSTALGLGVASLSDDDAAAWAQTLEHLNRLLQGLMVHAAGDLSERVSAGRYQESGDRKPVDFLSSSLHLSRAEANNRLRLADRFLPATDPLTYVVTPPSQPVLGSALFAGLISAEQAMVVSGFVDQASRLEKSGTVQAGDVESLEATLARHAEVEPPYFLRHLGIRALALLDPDGQKPSEAQRLAKQGISFRRPYRGWVRIDGYLTISQYEQTMACIDWATNPKRQNSSAQDAAQTTSAGDAHGDFLRSDFVQGDDVPGGSAQQESSQAFLSPDDLMGLLRDSASGLGTASPPAGSGPPPPEADPASDHHGTNTGHAKPASAPAPTPRATPETGQGWRRPLTADEIPLRPPNAPPDAIPPVYPGESWFWFPDLSGENNGWEPGPDDGLHGNTGPFIATEPSGGHQPFGAPEQCGGACPPETSWPPPKEEPEAAWWAGPVPPEGDDPDGTAQPEGNVEPWPHLVNGVWVPAPGSDEDLPGLSPMDPDSTDPAVRDRRTRAQMLLDGMLHCLRLAAGTDKLPINGGLKTQLYLSLTHEDLDRHAKGGTVNSPYSGQVPLSLFAEEMCDAGVTQLLVDSNGAILDVGRTQRLFTFAQRKILVARDMGCAFPGCMAPPQWTEAHHIVPWQDGGATSVNNGVLCCSQHHHYLHDRGWSVRLDGGVAWFTPPYSEDITRRERRNTYHHDRV